MSDNNDRLALPPGAFVPDLTRTYPAYSMAAFDRAVLARLERERAAEAEAAAVCMEQDAVDEDKQE